MAPHIPILDQDKLLTPTEIVEHNFLTQHEKIDRLQELKAEVTGAKANPDDVHYSGEEIDAAIAAVKTQLQNDGAVKTVISDQVAGR